MAGLFLTSSIQILRQSFREMREGRVVPVFALRSQSFLDNLIADFCRSRAFLSR
jgi:hypothetical protein